MTSIHVLQTQDEIQTGKTGKLSENPLKSLIVVSQSLTTNKNLLPKVPNKNGKLEHQFKIQEVCIGFNSTG